MTKKQEETAIKKARKIVLMHQQKLKEISEFVQSDSILFAIRLIDLVLEEGVLFSNPKQKTKTKQNAKRSKSTTR